MFLYSMVLVGVGRENEGVVGRKLSFISGLIQGKMAALALVQDIEVEKLRKTLGLCAQ